MKARAAVCIGLAGVAVVLSYTVQRLVDAAGEPPLSSVLLSGTIAYYWRVGIALLHGVVVASVAAVGLSEDRAITALRMLPVPVLGLGLLCVVAVLVVP